MTEVPKKEFDARSFLRNLTQKPGVYRMLDAEGSIIYVGKARNLKKRVSSYFSRSAKSPKTQALVANTHDMEITVTHTEGEALLLENHLIKEHRPRYNVLLRDDKSYPYIHVSTEQTFPRLAYHRGAKHDKGRYFGPYPSSHAVRESLNLLQKLFQVRQCEDSFFRNRSRPCLQHQIRRCSAPCVEAISEQDYRRDVENTLLFLEGKDNQVIDELVRRMEQAAERLEFEQAARYRDQIASMRRVQERQYVSGRGGDLDIIACEAGAGLACIQVFFVRAGRNLGNKAYFPRLPAGTDSHELLGAFLSQYYLERDIPAEIIVNLEPEDPDLLESVLTEQRGHKVSLTCRVRGERARWLEMAVANARHALQTRLASQAGLLRRFEALQEALDLEELPRRLECFDISHTQGEATVASCVVMDHEGPRKSDYRRFNIEGVRAGDDYAALRQALTRRYARLKEGEGMMPDILLIDGGKGQLGVAREVLEELQVCGVTLMGVAKGKERRPGDEQLFLSATGHPLILRADSPALHLIQQVRDEAHRFAITGHRARRARNRKTSPLEEIRGMGPKRRQQLLKQFGGLREISRAGVEDLCKVPGISRELAQRIYDRFHQDAEQA